MKHTLLTLMLALTFASAQTRAPQGQATAPANQSAAIPSTAPPPQRPTAPTNVNSIRSNVNIDTVRNYSITLPQLIQQSQQIILVTPDLTRADIAEAIRKAILNRGAEVVVITTKESLLNKTSFTFRLAMMRTKTFTASMAPTTQPILLLDGNAYTGKGIMSIGPTNRMPFQRNVETAKWLQQNITKLETEGSIVDQTQLVRLWYKKNLNILLW